MRSFWIPKTLLLLSLCLLAAGCGKSEDAGIADPAESFAAVDPVDPAPAPVEDDPTAAGASGSTVPVEGGVAILTPENTTIQFVGTHVGERPDPRTGVFTEFSGQAEVDEAGKTLEKVTVEIQTESLVTPIPKLTTHLKSPDFFDAREIPTARFESTSIEPSSGSAGEVTVTGNLTLHGTTKEITFPATVAVTDGGVALRGEFIIDRAEFGMDKLQDRVEKDVAMTVVVGQKTVPPTAGGPGPEAGGGRGDRAGLDPQAIFKERDADGDGKLSGDEIPDRMRENLDAIDADSDGAVTLEEFQERMRQMRGGGQ